MQINYQPFFRTLGELFQFAEKDIGWAFQFSMSLHLASDHKEQRHFFDLVEKVAKATKGINFQPPMKGAERRSDLKLKPTRTLKLLDLSTRVDASVQAKH